MRIDLTGRTAVVTGSAGGIGLAIAKGLAEAGADIVLNGPTQELVEAGLAKLTEAVLEVKVIGVVADLSTAEGANALVSAAPHADVLVNNVGIYSQRDFFDLTDDEWQCMFDLNVMSGVRLSRAYLPGMIARGWGRVLFLSSEAAIHIPADMIHYATTKTAYLTISRGLAKRAAGTGVTVNAILPGPTLSEGLLALLEAEQARTGKPIDEVTRDFVKRERPTSIIQRPATVEEVANLAVYIASPLASATTGAAMRVDGGVVESII
jgi:NAD(P)-dependent dehydrogenase (short-subunit alcohol dehydrogenase family)